MLKKTIGWWRENIEKLRAMKRLVLKYLSAPPSSTASEMLFSSPGAICSELRNRLAPENASKLIFVHENRALL